MPTLLTFNLGRPRRSKFAALQTELLRHNADIYILTETHRDFSLPGYEMRSSLPLDEQSVTYEEKGETETVTYQPGECRTQIFSRWKILRVNKVTNPHTNLCVDIEAPFGELRVYGCICGILGNRKPYFQDDFASITADTETLFPGYDVILAGDWNTAMEAMFWPSEAARKDWNLLLQKHGLIRPEPEPDAPFSVDHIAVSQSIAHRFQPEARYIFTTPKLSDHKTLTLLETARS